jgi:hypothetical protein
MSGPRTPTGATLLSPQPSGGPDYADFVAAGTATTSAFGLDVGIIGMSA